MKLAGVQVSKRELHTYTFFFLKRVIKAYEKKSLYKEIYLTRNIAIYIMPLKFI